MDLTRFDKRFIDAYNTLFKSPMNGPTVVSSKPAKKETPDVKKSKYSDRYKEIRGVINNQSESSQGLYF